MKSIIGLFCIVISIPLAHARDLDDTRLKCTVMTFDQHGNHKYLFNGKVTFPNGRNVEILRTATATYNAELILKSEISSRFSAFGLEITRLGDEKTIAQSNTIWRSSSEGMLSLVLNTAHAEPELDTQFRCEGELKHD